MSLPAALAVACVQAYRYTVGSLLPPSCRFEPTCSAYAIEALQRHGAARGGWLTVRRLGRCHPWCAGGFDPVPDSGPVSHADSSPKSGPAAEPGLLSSAAAERRD